MRKIHFAGAVAALLSLTACGPSGPDSQEQQKQQPQAAAATHSASGTVESVSGSNVTIAHGAVESIGWPAMTMTFAAEDDTLLAGVKPGDRVSFEFLQANGGYRLTRLSKL
jgi:Cu(I)/Ag(I) efflux system protein CusF